MLNNVKLKNTLVARSFVIPVMLLLALLILYPFIYGIFVSFYDTNLISRWNFEGLQNYIEVIKDSTFWNSMRITVLFTVFTVLGHFVLGLLFASFLNKPIKGVVIFRCIFMLPWLLPEVVIANLWKFIFNPNDGIINYYLSFANLIREPLIFLSNPKIALATVIFVCIWKGFPLIMIQILAALQTVPAAVVEAAKIDGATRLQTFWKIVIPSIKGTITVALILDTIWWFKHVSMVWILTQGGPGVSTNTIGIEIYKRAFAYFDFGYSSAIAFIVFIVCVLITLVYKRVLQDGE